MTDNELKKNMIDAMVNGLYVECDLSLLEEEINIQMDPKYEVVWASPDDTLRGCVIHDEDKMPCLVVRIHLDTGFISFTSPFIHKLQEGDDIFGKNMAFQFMYVLKAIQIANGELAIREKQFMQPGDSQTTTISEDDWIL